MQTITIGGRETRIAATPMTPWIYKRAFDADMLSEVTALAALTDDAGMIDYGKLPLFGLIQMTWAMARTVEPKTPDFTSWLGSLEFLDYNEIDFGAVMEELQRGFFRSAQGPPDPQVEQAQPSDGGEPGAGDTGLGETDGA